VDFSELQGVLSLYLRDEHDVLHVGCGNSHLTEVLWSREICKTITNIDISDVLIARMKEQSKGTVCEDSRVRWMVMDVCNMSFAAASFDLILEKGTLDALLCESEEKLDVVHAMLDECFRVLRPSGCLLLVTHGNPSDRLSVLQRSSTPWTVTSHKVCYSLPSLLMRELRQGLEGRALSTLEAAQLAEAERKTRDVLQAAKAGEISGDHLKADESPFCWLYACRKAGVPVAVPPDMIAAARPKRKR